MGKKTGLTIALFIIGVAGLFQIMTPFLDEIVAQYGQLAGGIAFITILILLGKEYSV